MLLLRFTFFVFMFFCRDEYTLEELKQKPIPEGVDPTRIEFFLNKEEFKVSFLRKFHDDLRLLQSMFNYDSRFR